MSAGSTPAESTSSSQSAGAHELQGLAVRGARGRVERRPGRERRRGHSLPRRRGRAACHRGSSTIGGEGASGPRWPQALAGACASWTAIERRRRRPRRFPHLTRMQEHTGRHTSPCRRGSDAPCGSPCTAPALALRARCRQPLAFLLFSLVNGWQSVRSCRKPPSAEGVALRRVQLRRQRVRPSSADCCPAQLVAHIQKGQRKAQPGGMAFEHRKPPTGVEHSLQSTSQSGYAMRSMPTSLSLRAAPLLPCWWCCRNSGCRYGQILQLPGQKCYRGRRQRARQGARGMDIFISLARVTTGASCRGRNRAARTGQPPRVGSLGL